MMAVRRKGTRVYLRGRRYWGDFRDLGGGQEALIPPREARATTDPDVAADLATQRVKELESLKRNMLLFGVDRQSNLQDYAIRHLELKAKGGEGVRSWLQQSQRHLQAAAEFFGAEIDLVAVSPEDVTRWVEHLRRQDNGRGGTLGETSVRKYINSLSNMYRRAVSERYVKANPVADMYSKPTEDRVEPAWLQPEEAALLLEAARTYQPPTGTLEQEHGGAISPHANPWIYAILATFLLTGGRKSEVLGLEVDDVSFRLGKVYFRSNQWRRLKTKGSKRSVPLWPQLREVLEAYLLERARQGGPDRLLFPSIGGRPRGAEGEEPTKAPAPESEKVSGERMIRDLRKTLDAIGERAGLPAGHVRLHMLRHTYSAARIQTLDRGAPVALYTVARELGHSSQSMIEERYGHLHDRAILGGAEEVSFRIKDHRDQLEPQLEALRK